MVYFNSELYEEASRAYQNAHYYKALSIYSGAYRKLFDFKPIAQLNIDFFDTKAYLESRITIVLISLLSQTPIKNNVLPTLSKGWEEIREGMIKLSNTIALLKPHPTQLATTKNLEETGITLVTKCDEISCNLQQFCTHEERTGPMPLAFLNAAYDWKLRTFDLSSQFDIPIAPEAHLDLLILRELQFQHTKDISILENMRHHIVTYDLLNTMKKANKLELFCYYLRCSPNIDSTELTDIKTQGETIISGLKKPRIIIKEFQNEITSLEKKPSPMLTPESNEPIVPSPSSGLKSILKKSHSNPNAPRKKVSFFLAISNDSQRTYISPFTRFNLMIIDLSQKYGSNEFSANFLSLCGEFFFNTTLIPCKYSIEDSLMFPILNEIYTAAHECVSLPETKCQALLITTVSSTLMALKPFINASHYEEMIEELYNDLLKTIKNSPSKIEDNEGIARLMNHVFNPKTNPDVEEEIRFSPAYA